ncbi:transcription factor RelB isoform X2 [Denticeps clupeoides]|nr:transcription factor RelB isoform X2 [Denticeps clupeoides]XP_028856971.1 transcription factor RelB isoform X2 [Denticeps clupeoides]
MRGSRAGASRRGRGGPAAPPTRPAAPGTEMLERLLERPQLVVVEQPKERGMRFRYECEGRSAGSILGAGSTEANKTIPSIELQGPMDKIAKVTVTVSLVTKDIPHRPHPHCLVGKDCSEGICIVTINPHTSRQHSFSNLGIQCVRRKELDASLAKRRSQNIDPFNTGQLRSIEDMDMNVVRLCFQCELERLDGETVLLGPVVSNPIYDKKATTTSELKINRLNVVRGTCTGKTEIYMLCDKVQKDDIEIIFSHGGWEAKAEFAQTDVHRQIAIVFKSPPFQEQDLEDEVEVNVFLRRLSDHMDSEPVKFTYLPNNQDPYEVNRKRKIKSDGRFRDECSAAGPGMMADAPAFQPFLQLPLPGDNSAAAMATAAPEDLLQPGENFPDIPYDDHSILMNLVHFLEGMVTPSVPSSAFPVDDPNMNLLSDDLQMTPAFYNDLQFSQMVINSQQQFDAGAAQPEDVGTSPVKVENDAPRRDAAP